MAETGSWIGDKYRILGCLGQGGSSQVYLVEDRKLHLRWAMKEIETSDIFASHTKGVWNEIEILKAIQHPRIPRVVDMISQQGCFYVVMDYVEGKSLKEIRESQERIRVEQIVDWGIQVCEILEYLHGQEPPVIYRDLKPDHLILQADGKLKLIDFGISRRYKADALEDTVVLGTANYVSPEQCRGIQTDQRSDLYSFGVTMYWIWKHRFPWEKRHLIEEARQQDLRLEHILAHCMKQKPARRYRSSKKVKKRLCRLRTKRQKEKPIHICRRLVLITACFCVLVLAFYQAVQQNGVGAIGGAVALSVNRHAAREQLLAAAERTPDAQEQKRIVQNYVCVHPSDEKGYEALFEVWQKDGLLDEEEREEMECLIYEQEEQLKETGLYGDVLFQVGRTYWYYYQNAQGEVMNLQGISAAKTWFAESISYLQDEKRLSLAACYIEIGDFYEQIKSLTAQGLDGDVYGNLWEELEKMGQLVQEDASQEHEIMQLEYACLAGSAAESYGVIWMENGVSKQQLNALKERLASICEQVSGKGERQQQMIAYILQTIR